MPTPVLWETLVAYAALALLVSFLIGALIGRAIPRSSNDPKLRDLRETHAGSDTVS